MLQEPKLYETFQTDGFMGYCITYCRSMNDRNLNYKISFPLGFSINQQAHFLLGLIVMVASH